MGLALFFIYTLFSEYREKEFQQRQREKISTTLRFITEIRQLEDNLIEALDRLTIHDLYDEKLLIFDRDKKLIYSSLDDTPIRFPGDILNKLSKSNPWIEHRDGLYDVIGVYIENGDQSFYGISKAYDFFGYSKLNYLRNVLVASFIGISVIIVLICYYLSKKIAQPIIAIAQRINQYDFELKYEPIYANKANREIFILAEQFNKLMKRMSDVFAFQKHAIHHISHELKTPVSILVSNFERMEKETDQQVLKALIEHQKADTKSLGDIINSLLEIAKAESGHAIIRDQVRIDELLFDLVDELNVLYPSFRFSVNFESELVDDKTLLVKVNIDLIRAAFTNLMLNCIHYSSKPEAQIIFIPKPQKIEILLVNTGPLINESEKQFLFQHFFRGNNSKGKPGFGLGLVFVHKIVQLHHGTITYSNDQVERNIFSLELPLS